MKKLARLTEYKNKLKKKKNIFFNRDLIFFKIKFENLSNI